MEALTAKNAYDYIMKAKKHMEVNKIPMNSRKFLIGKQWQVDYWRDMYGDSVDYIVLP